MKKTLKFSGIGNYFYCHSARDSQTDPKKSPSFSSSLTVSLYLSRLTGVIADNTKKKVFKKVFII